MTCSSVPRPLITSKVSARFSCPQTCKAELGATVCLGCAVEFNAKTPVPLFVKPLNVEVVHVLRSEMSGSFE